MNMSKEEKAKCDQHNDQLQELIVRITKLEIWVKVGAAAGVASIIGSKVSVDVLQAIAALM